MPHIYQMNIQIYSYSENDTNTNTNIILGQFYSIIQIFVLITFKYSCSSLGKYHADNWSGDYHEDKWPGRLALIIGDGLSSTHLAVIGKEIHRLFSWGYSA